MGLVIDVNQHIRATLNQPVSETHPMLRYSFLAFFQITIKRFNNIDHSTLKQPF